MDEHVDPPQIETEPDSRTSPAQPPSRVAPRRTRFRVGRLIVASFVLAAVLAGGWYWRSSRTSENPGTTTATRPGGTGRPGLAPPQPVGAATVDKGNIRIVLNQLGTVTSLDTVTVLTQINGQLQEVAFQEGQTVKKGDFLVQIDPRPYQAALEQAQGTLAHDQGLLAQAQSDLKRFVTLGRQDSIAQQQVEDQKFLVQQYTGTVQTDQGTVDNAKLNLAYCHIVSPIDGQVGLRQIDQGNYVQTSNTSGLVVITQMQPISVLFSVPEDNLPDIIQRVRSGATLSVEAYDRANTRLLATGQLGTLDNLIDTTTGTLKLRAIFANPDELLYPNQFVNARLLVSTMSDAIRVPVPAVQRGEPGTFVYVIDANNTVSVRPIKVGPVDGNYQAVLSGLQPGERVVTDGTDRLREGAAVTVPSPQASQGQAAGTRPTGAEQAQPGQAQPGQAQPGQAQLGQAQTGQATTTGQAQPGQPQPPQADPGQGQPAQSQPAGEHEHHRPPQPQ
jgi:membrane fusion protein, multidrug efflux system